LSMAALSRADEKRSLDFLMHAILRLGGISIRPAGIVAVIFIFCCVAVVGTKMGYGPFARPSPNDSLLLLQVFLGLKVVMTLAFAAEVSERRRQEEHSKLLSVTDPLTGLANYRLCWSALIWKSNVTADGTAIFHSAAGSRRPEKDQRRLWASCRKPCPVPGR